MTEAEWLSSTDSAPMLDYLSGKATARQLRLFAAACCRAVCPMLTDQRSLAAVVAAERSCEGAAAEAELAGARHAAKAAIPSGKEFRPAEQAAAAAAVAALDPDPERAARLACGWARNVRLALAFEEGPADLRAAQAEVVARWAADSARLVHDIFGKALPNGPQGRPAIS
jgi:hypothetical protein